MSKSKKAYYFSHDRNARHDPKILKLRYVHGWQGYGIYWALIEKLSEEPDYILAKDYDVLSFDLRVEPDLIKSCVEDFELFKITDDDKEFYSESLMRRMELFDYKSEQARKAAQARWGKKPSNTEGSKQEQSDSNAPAMHPHSDSNTDAEQTQSDRNALKYSIVKESKGNNSKEEKDSSVFSFNDFWDAYPNKASKKVAEKRYEKITESDRQKIKDTLQDFTEHKPFANYKHPHAATYLNQERWNDEIINNTKQSSNETEIKIDREKFEQQRLR